MAKKAEHPPEILLLEKLDYARRLLWIHGMITQPEREKITKRIMKWGKKAGITIQRKPAFSD